jgi:primosomal protein N' (replication factor Y)
VKQNQLFDPDPLPWLEADREDILCAQVVFNRPLDQTYDYRIPGELRDRLQAGQRLRVPFGRGDRLTVGYCVGIGKPQRTDGLKTVHSVLDRAPLLDARMLELTRWIADRYLCTWGQVLDTVVPAGVKNQAGTREMLWLRLDAEAVAALGDSKLPPKQAAVLQVLQAAGEPMLMEQVARTAGVGPGPITGLRRKRLVQAFAERTATGSQAASVAEPTADLELNADQQNVLDRIVRALRGRQHETFVLYGVTGSGKTEVYIRAIREVVGYGRQAIVLVPEISLTPQTIRRFQSRFGSIAVLHSHLTDVERHRHWQTIASGQVQVVVGARSAIFAPTPHLGLIVIDEEHETSFKQDNVPRYHAREVARQRAKMEGIPLVLGSATPTLESLQRSFTNEHELLRLPRRVEGLPMPPVVIVDIRHDPQCARGHAIGRALQTSMRHALDQEGQVILFLNLRGYSPVLWCRACGEVAKCPQCDISLTWHKEDKVVRCHTCDYQTLPPSVCPNCQQPGLRYLGAGTQRLEQEVRAKFPQAACMRMDSDSMRRRGSHDETLEAFRRGEVRILLGTQMISKGLDFPNVTLVGVVHADTVLHQPDLRAAERTFQLIAQVAGRTGRSHRGGRVLVQTSCPAEPSIVSASKHDYWGFANAELEHRRQMRAPPFEHLSRVIVRGPEQSEVQSAVRQLAETCRATAANVAPGVRILGPAPAPVARVKGDFRYHFQLSAVSIGEIQAVWRGALSSFSPPRRVEFAMDVDPVNLR